MKTYIKQGLVHLLIFAVLALGLYLHSAQAVSKMEKQMLQEKISDLQTQVELLKK